MTTHDPAAETWVIEEDGRLVAFMSLLGNMIGGLFAHSDQQGRGHGRALIEYAPGRYEPLFVEVFEANRPAIRLLPELRIRDHQRRTDKGSGLTQLILRMKDPYLA